MIKNTGHDLLGKSTGSGALGIWTHNLKSIDFITSYKGANYRGAAAKIGAGVQSWEIHEATASKGLRVLGGACPTVSIAGGYTQGGGHSTLSSIYGLSADNVLEWEVVTADGRHITATPTKHADLYWALSGGGDGTYAVVLSVTVKAHPDGAITTAGISFASANISEDAYWAAITAFHKNLPVWVDKGGHAAYVLLKTFFFAQPLTFPGLNSVEVTNLTAPFARTLSTLNIPYNLNITTFPNYLSAYSAYFGPLPYGPYPSTQVQGGRLIPRSLIQEDAESLTALLRRITDTGVFQIIGSGLTVAKTPRQNANAVLPAWRDALISLIVYSPWDWTAPWQTQVAKQRQITSEIVPSLEKITPNSGTYMNEGNPEQVGWQREFYGANYERLRSVKRKYDREDLFYATTAVGSDDWEVAGDRRLCRLGEGRGRAS